MKMWTVVRAALATLLIVTAALKVSQASAIFASDGMLASQAVLALVVSIEVFAAIVIATAPRWIARAFALLFFSGLATVAALTWWHNEDCGCFGVQSPKGLPVLVDTLAISLILWSLKRESARKNDRKQAGAIFFSSVLAASIAAIVTGGLVAWRVERLKSAGPMPGWFGENLKGSRLPLLSDDRFATQVPKSGDALFVLLRPDCPHCREFAAKWPELSQGIPPSLSVIGVSISHSEWTVMPGIVSADAINTADGFVLEWNDNEPFVSSPTLLAVRDRNVHNIFLPEQVNALSESSVTFMSLFSEKARPNGITSD